MAACFTIFFTSSNAYMLLYLFTLLYSSIRYLNILDEIFSIDNFLAVFIIFQYTSCIRFNNIQILQIKHCQLISY